MHGNAPEPNAVKFPNSFLCNLIFRHRASSI